MEISDEARKRLLQSGFLAGLAFIDSFKYSLPKDLPEEELEEIKNALDKLFEDYGLPKGVV